MQKNLLASGVATAGVALGIGAAALALGTGTASAAPSESTSSSTSPSDSADTKARVSDKTDPDTKDSDTKANTSKSEDTSDNDAEDNDAEDNDAEDKGAEDKGAEDKGAEDKGAEDKGAANKDTEDNDAEIEPDAETEPGESVDHDESVREEGSADLDSDLETPVQVETPAEEAVKPVAAEQVSSVTSDDTVTGRDRPLPVIPEAPRPADPGLPAVPPSTPVEFFNWVGSQIQRTLFNRTPTASPVQYVQTGAGEVVGSVRGSDAEGDKLVYTLVTGPTRGTVVLHDDGSFTYTPDPTLIGDGGADSFTVDVHDVGPHLHMFNGTGTARTDVVVGVKADGDVDQNVGNSTRGFNIYNLSGENMVFKGYTKGGNRVDSGPAVGTVITPGSNVHIEVVFRFFDDDEVVAQFSTENQGDVTAYMLVTSLDGDAFAACRGSYCTPNTVDYQDTSTVVFLDAPGTIIDVPAGQGQRQAELLNGLCYDGSQATCNFEVGRQEKWYTEGQQASSTFSNDSDGTQSITRGVSDSKGYSDSLGGNAKFGFKLTEAINFEIQATYNHTWTTTHTWSENITLQVPPWTEASLYLSAPMNRVYGDLVIDVGNTRWYLRDVYFDSPDDTGFLTYRPHYVPIPHDQAEDVTAVDL